MDPDFELSSPLARGNRVKSLRKIIKMSRKALGLRYDISSGTLQNWEDGRFGGLTEKGAKKIISAFLQEGIACKLEWLMYGTGENPLHKKVYLPALPAEIACSSTESDIIARELECFHQLNSNSVDTMLIDNCMAPYYCKGDHVAGRRYFGKDIKRLVGQDCIVQTQSGQLLVRSLQQGTEEDSYRLICYHPDPDKNDQSTEDTRLMSAAPVIWIRRKNLLEDKE